MIEIRCAVQDEAPLVADLHCAREAAVPAIPPSVHDRDDVHDHFATTVRYRWRQYDEGSRSPVELRSEGS